MSQPNVVVIMTDQQRWDALGAAGNHRIRTPHLDRLAAEGAFVERAFVPVPLCIPSRAALFTGRYPSRSGLGPNSGFPLPVDAPNVASTLRAAGYRTILVGKDHLFGGEGLAHHFDHVVRYDHAGRAVDEKADAEERALRASRQGRFDEPFIERDAFDTAHSPTRRLTTAAIDAVGDAHARPQPFFLWLSYPDPHPPYVVAEPYASMYRDHDLGMPATRPGELDGKPPRQRLSHRLMGTADYPPRDLQRLREIYYGMVTFIDDEIGRFTQALDDQGIGGDTIVVFMSDHGDYMGDHGMVRKSPAMYDCLVRIPLIIRWPGHISPGRIANTLVSSIDLAPTLLDFAGLPPLPAAEGISLAPLLAGRARAHRDRVFGLYGSAGDAVTDAELAGIDLDAFRAEPHPWMGPLAMRGRMAMVRTAEWKLVHHQGAPGELYDLHADPDELINRFADPACIAVRAELMGSLVDFLLE
ncbi:MAG: sulfatase-like hydrolase/transferase [Chloroflexia bacterium]|nr:sulfatase-like hydrolase/transferase [Chloroflexia bacterium]